MALSQKVMDQQMTVLDELRLERIKTKDFAAIIKRFELDKALLVLGKRDEIIEKSARNLFNIKVLRAEGLNVYDLINYPNVLLTQETIGAIEEALQS